MLFCTGGARSGELPGWHGREPRRKAAAWPLTAALTEAAARRWALSKARTLCLHLPTHRAPRNAEKRSWVPCQQRDEKKPPCPGCLGLSGGTSTGACPAGHKAGGTRETRGTRPHRKAHGGRTLQGKAAGGCYLLKPACPGAPGGKRRGCWGSRPSRSNAPRAGSGPPPCRGAGAPRPASLETAGDTFPVHRTRLAQAWAGFKQIRLVRIPRGRRLSS